MTDNNQGIPKSLVLLMAASSGAIVANLYYSQPLLAEIARDISIDESLAGFIPALTQVGYGIGLLFISPLGDQAEKRKLIVTLVLLAAAALAFTGTVRTASLLLPLNLLVGLLSVVPQIMLPYVATISDPLHRSKNVGTVMSGLLLGILLARTASGIIGEHFGWRTLYFCAAGLMVFLAVQLRIMLPESRTENPPGYIKLLSSLPALIKKLPPLQEASLSGALLFASFSVFWSTLIFHLESMPSHLGAQEAGLFGLVGAAGALAASLSGRLSDRLGPVRIMFSGYVLIFLSWVIMWGFHSSLIALAAGAALLDLGVQGAHVANQTRIFAHMPEARSRINTIYIVSFFTGGSLGSLAGAFIWKAAGWTGVCLLGTLLMLCAFTASYALSRRKYEPE
jgi:predicted MFS family arabinose efflux permease